MLIPSFAPPTPSSLDKVKSTTDNLEARKTKVSCSRVPSRCPPPLTHAPFAQIFCTLGPSCWSKEMLVQMIDAGMDVGAFPACLVLGSVCVPSFPLSPLSPSQL